tara:strand:- start:18567 stop:19394 length:828 start_codon:yes stop_codon:yes gene_type:complete
MNILIVDGNEKEASDKYTDMGMDTQYEVYSKVINNLSNNKCNIFVIHPAVKDMYMPLGLSLDDFDGIVWTGSVLNIYDMTPPITKQIDLAKNISTRKNKIFGSCWGLQVLVTAAGGQIRKNPNGLEAVVAKDIEINENGLDHKLYKGKNKKFDAFCWHYDEVETLPQNAVVLSSNKMSEVQSVYFDFNKSKVWAVQYHPEFNPVWIGGLMNQREEILLKEKAFESKDKFKRQRDIFLNNNVIENEERIYNYDDLLNDRSHTLELANWIEELKSKI